MSTGVSSNLTGGTRLAGEIALMLSPTLPLAHSSMCDHKYGLVITYTRPWYKLFKKRMHIRCWFCDLKVSE